MKRNHKIAIGVAVIIGGIYTIKYLVNKRNNTDPLPKVDPVVNQISQSECEKRGGVYSSGFAGGFICLGAKF